MSSPIKVAQDSARGTLILFAGNVLYTGIATVATVLIARLLGPDGYGTYTLALVVPSILFSFVGFGVNSAVTRYVAFYISSGDIDRAKSITRTATTFLLLCGISLSAVNYFGAGYFVDVLLGRPQLVSYVQVASLLILGQTLSQCATSIFIGWSSMLEQSAFNVLQGALKLVLSAGLILIGFGIYGAVFGHVFSFVVQGILAILVLYFAHMSPWSRKSNHFREDIRLMLRYGFPVFAAVIVSGLASQYVTIILASIATNAVVGYYQAALNVTVAITVISGAVGNVLFRSFAALDGLAVDTSLAFSYAVKYVSFILTPVVFLLIAAAGPLFEILYGHSYIQGVLLLKLVALASLPVSIGYTVLPSFFNGVGKSRIFMFVTIVGSLALAMSGFLLGVTLGLGARGIMLAFLVSNLAMTIPGLLVARSYQGARLSPKPLAGIVVAAFLAWLAVSVLSLASLPALVSLVVDCVVYACVYLTCVPLVWGVDGDDIVRLSIAGDSLGPFRTILTLTLRYEKLILRIARRV